MWHNFNTTSLFLAELNSQQIQNTLTSQETVSICPLVTAFSLSSIWWRRTSLLLSRFRGSVKHSEGDILMCLCKDKLWEVTEFELKRVLTCGSDSAAIHPAIVETDQHILSILQLDFTVFSDFLYCLSLCHLSSFCFIPQLSTVQLNSSGTADCGHPGGKDRVIPRNE